MDELQTHTNPTFQHFDTKDACNSCGNFSLGSSKGSLFSYAEAKSSDTVIMPFMVNEVANFEEELESMKAMLDRISKESALKDAQIKLQNEYIAELIKKLKKKSSKASNKG